MKLLHTIFILTFISIAVSLSSQEVGSESELRSAADRMRFENARQFYELEKYDLALERFYEYLEVYHNGNHRESALNLISEIHLQNFEYNEAAKIYDKLYQEFSNSESGISAYYKKGICYTKMGYNKNALSVFKYIIANHPGTKAAFDSEIQMELLKITSN